ncbi:MAG: helix-turn-helix transcriptional regulator [Bacteroidota bacterium]
MENNPNSTPSVELTEPGIQKTTWIDMVEQYILEHLDNSKLTIADLALSFSLSERQFHRRVKQETGMTPNLFIRRIKLAAAKKMLEDKKFATIAETAMAVGYNQADYFSRLFTAYYGYRPVRHLRNSARR